MMWSHPLMSTYPGASFAPPPGHPFHTHLNPHGGLNGNFNGPHLPYISHPEGGGGSSLGYWAHVPWEIPSLPFKQIENPYKPGEIINVPDNMFKLPPAIEAALEGRGTGIWGLPINGRGEAFNYGWPKYGPMPLKPELGGFVGKINPYGRGFPHGFYKTVY